MGDRREVMAKGPVGPDEEPVVVVPYDPRWPRRYEEERARILGVLAHVRIDVEHVGSTAVPGLGAKPVVDILIGLRELADGERWVKPLEGLGYEYKGELGIPGRLYFRRLVRRRRAYQVHMVEKGSAFWERHLLFRNYLRDHPARARKYYELKVRLAEQYGTDREGYTEAKTDFIRSVEAEARACLQQA
ncbi:MAG: GrpB family protein [Chloroflexi bacterium]|nr:GrpB family protein [Chloroflexota bacterium]